MYIYMILLLTMVGICFLFHKNLILENARNKLKCSDCTGTFLHFLFNKNKTHLKTNYICVG